MARWLQGSLLYRKIRNLGGAGIVKYFIVGGTAAIVDLLCLYVLIERFHLHYLAANTCSFLIATTVNYFVGTFIMFESRNASKELMQVFFVSLSALMLSNIIMYVGTTVFGIYYLLVKVVSQGIGFFWNYLGRTQYIYKNRSNNAVT